MPVRELVLLAAAGLRAYLRLLRCRYDTLHFCLGRVSLSSSGLTFPQRWSKHKVEKAEFQVQAQI